MEINNVWKENRRTGYLEREIKYKRIIVWKKIRNGKDWLFKKVIREGKEWLIIKKIRDRKGLLFGKEIRYGNTDCS